MKIKYCRIIFLTRKYICDRSKFGTLNLSNKIRFIKVKTVSTKVDITKLKLDTRPILDLFRKTAILKISIRMAP